MNLLSNALPMEQFIVVDVGYRKMLFAFPPHEHGHRDAALFVKDLP